MTIQQLQEEAQKEFDTFFQVRRFKESASWKAPDCFTMINFINSQIEKAFKEGKEEKEVLQTKMEWRSKHSKIKFYNPNI